MYTRSRILCLLLIAILAAGSIVPAWAQEPEPAQWQPPVTDDPAVAMVLRSNPQTPAELVRAATMLANLGRGDLGRQYLGQAIGAGLDEQQLTGLSERFGLAALLGMAARPEMQPEAGQLADAVLAALNRALRDPAKIAERIGQLADPSPEVRFRASTGLVEAGPAAVGPLVAVLADAGRAAEHAAVRAVLVRKGPEAVGPMVAVLGCGQPGLTIQAIQVLALVGDRQAAIHLLRPHGSATADPAVRAAAAAALERLIGRTPTEEEALATLVEQARAYFDRKQQMKQDVDGRVQLWRWDPDNRQCVLGSYPVEVAASISAARLARDAYALAAEDRQVRLLYLAAILEEAGYEAGLGEPLPDGPGTAMAEAAAFGPATIQRLLEYAVAGDHVPAATAAAVILGRIGSAEDLLRQGTEVSGLVRAIRHGDRRLRMAATDAVIRLQSARPFPGSSYVPESLAYFAASTGSRRVLVAGGSTEAQRELFGLLIAAGFEVDTAASGRELLAMVVASPDYELAMIDVAIDRPPIDPLLQQLRRDCRGATLRVGLIAREGYLARARQVARQDPLALAFSRPHSNEAMAEDVAQLAAIEPLAFVGREERQRQAAWAIDRLLELSGPANRLYNVGRAEDVVLAALYRPASAAKAAAVLGNLGTAEGQQALVDLASRWTQPIEVRLAALGAFRQSVQARGILLTRQQILEQYDRYNASESMDRPTQEVLGLILDCIEAPTRPVQAEMQGFQR